ncbi:hypothetical protein BH09GEM1_BH09GEM1_12700 [soil metagenome]
MTLRRFFRTPKGSLLLVLAVLVVVATIGEGVALVLPGLMGAIVPGVVIDALILRRRKHRWVFPDGALLTAIIVAMVLSPREPWYVAAITTALAIASKYLARVRSANVFNPAALALLVTFFLFSTEQSWWGALPEMAPPLILLLIASGVFVADRVKKMPLVLSCLGCYYLLFTLAAFFGDPAHVEELYRSPDVHAALYFAFFMVTDPPTSPPKARDQLVNGAIVAVASFAVFELVGAVYFLLAGLLVANVWEVWRRYGQGRRRAVQRPMLTDTATR